MSLGKAITDDEMCALYGTAGARFAVGDRVRDEYGHRGVVVFLSNGDPQQPQVLFDNPQEASRRAGYVLSKHPLHKDAVGFWTLQSNLYHDKT